MANTNGKSSSNGHEIDYLVPKFAIGERVHDHSINEDATVEGFYVGYKLRGTNDGVYDRWRASEEELSAAKIERTEEQAWTEAFRIMLNTAKAAAHNGHIVSATEYRKARASIYRVLGSAHIKISKTGPVKEAVRQMAHDTGEALGVAFVE